MAISRAQLTKEFNEAQKIDLIIGVQKDED